jgi:hypothetical protein
LDNLRKTGSVRRRKGVSTMMRKLTLYALCVLITAASAGVLRAFAPPDRRQSSFRIQPIDSPLFRVRPSPKTFSLSKASRLRKEAWEHFLAKAGPRWTIKWDTRTDRPYVIEGQGIPWFPGAGNTLTWKEVESAGWVRGKDAPLALLESRALAVLKEHADLLQTPIASLRLNDRRSGTYAFGKYASVQFDYLHRGVPVEGAGITFHANGGNLFQIVIRGIMSSPLDPKPSISREAAWAKIMQTVDPRGEKTVEVVQNGSLQVIPMMTGGADRSFFPGKPGTGLVYILSWRFVFRVEGAPETWEAHLDAHSGELTRLVDINGYDEMVKGKIYPITTNDDLVVRPFTETTVENPGRTGLFHLTNDGGWYDYLGGVTSARTWLTGRPPDAAALCVDDNCAGTLGVELCCPGEANETCDGLSPPSAPRISNVRMEAPNGGALALGGVEGATDCESAPDPVTFRTDTNASRTTAYHLRRLMNIVRGYAPDHYFGVSDDVHAVVNADPALSYGACNGALHPEGDHRFSVMLGRDLPPNAICNNLGEINSVIAHEFGHGFHGLYGGSMSWPTSYEAGADVMGVISTHEPCMGDSLHPDIPCTQVKGCDGTRPCTGLRYVAGRTSAGDGARPDNIGSDPFRCECVDGGGAQLGYYEHCESLIISGAYWDLAQLLRRRLGSLSGWTAAEALFLWSTQDRGDAFLNAGGKCYDPGGVDPAAVDGCNVDSWYRRFLEMDDDDGNLSNGTPNGDLIYEAFKAHGIACDTWQDETAPAHNRFSVCPEWTIPELTRTVVPPSAPDFPGAWELTWTGIDGATGYIIYRNDLGCNRAFQIYGYVPATEERKFTDAEIGDDPSIYHYSVQAVSFDPRARLDLPNAGPFCRSPMSACEEDCGGFEVAGGPDRETAAGTSVQLGVEITAAVGEPCIKWIPSDTLDDPSSRTPVATFPYPFPERLPYTLTYTVIVTDERGCARTDQVSVTVTEPTVVLVGTQIKDGCDPDSADGRVDGNEMVSLSVWTCSNTGALYNVEGTLSTGDPDVEIGGFSPETVQCGAPKTGTSVYGTVPSCGDPEPPFDERRTMHFTFRTLPGHPLTGSIPFRVDLRNDTGALGCVRFSIEMDPVDPESRDSFADPTPPDAGIVFLAHWPSTECADGWGILFYWDEVPPCTYPGCSMSCPYHPESWNLYRGDLGRPVLAPAMPPATWVDGTRARPGASTWTASWTMTQAPLISCSPGRRTARRGEKERKGPWDLIRRSVPAAAAPAREE